MACQEGILILITNALEPIHVCNPPTDSIHLSSSPLGNNAKKECSRMTAN